MTWLWHSISEGRTTPGGAVSAAVEDDGFISLFMADPGGGVYTARGSLSRTAGPLSTDLGDALAGGIPVPGGEARLFERGATLTSNAGEALVNFALPPIGVPSIATGEAAGAAVLDPGAITCRPRGWDVDQCVAAVRALFADRVALQPTGKPPSPVPLTLGAPVEVGVWGMWSSVSQGATVPGAPVSAVLGDDSLISLFVADPGGGVYTVRGNHAAGWGQWQSVSQGSTTPGGAVTAIAERDGFISLFLADPGGGVFTARGNHDAGWGPWQSVSQGATVPGAPVSAVLGDDGLISLFVADPGGGVYTVRGNHAAGWGQWQSVSQGSTTPGGAVTAIAERDGFISLFLADPGGGVFTARGNHDAGWGPWQSVSQGATVPGAPVSAVLGDDGLISLFVADPGGGVYTVRGNHAAGWGQWQSVSQGSTTPGGAVTAIAERDGFISLFLADPAGGTYGARGHAQDPASAGEDVTYGLPISAALEERQLYDIAVRRDDGAWHAIAPHSIYYRSSWHDFGIAHVTDIHLARRIDYFPGRLEAAGRPESARRMSNWNDRFRGFIRYANYLHRLGVLDVILATGDIIDYLFEADDDEAGGGNALFARETLLGRWPTERFPDVEELLVPIFMVPGNHDYRRLPYHLLCNLDLGLPFDVAQLPQFANYKMNWDDAFAAQGGKPGDDVPSLSAETAAKAIEIARDLTPYRTHLADKTNYVVRLGSHRIVMLDSGPDTDLPESKLDLLLYALGYLGEDERAAIGGSPNSEGVTDEMLTLAVDTLNETPDDGLFILGLHAPLFSMALEENPYFFRETQREAQAGQVYGWLARQDEDSAPAADETPGTKARQRHPLWFNGSGDPDGVSFVKRGDPADLLDYGVSRGASTALLEALAGVGQRRQGDVVLHGHIHRHNEFRLRDGNGELAYLTDFYTRNLSRYYPTRFVKDWTLPGTPDSDVASVDVAAGAAPGGQPVPTQPGSERKYAVTVPPYAEPLSQAADPRAWWTQRRPLVLQTEALGPFKNAEANLAGFRVLVVKDDVIERVHHVSIETLHAANYQIDWESLIAPEI